MTTKIHSWVTWLVSKLTADGERTGEWSFPQVLSEFEDRNSEPETVTKRLVKCVAITVILDMITKASGRLSVASPFVNVLSYLDKLLKRSKFEHRLNNSDPDSRKQIRAEVILLLNYPYNLKPLDDYKVQSRGCEARCLPQYCCFEEKRMVMFRNEDILAFCQWNARSAIPRCTIGA